MRTARSWKKPRRISRRIFVPGKTTACRQAALFPGERLFAESQKEAARFWAAYCLMGIRGGPSLSQIPGSEDPLDFSDGKEDIDQLLHLVTTDGEELVLTEVHFRVRDESAVRKRLSTLRSFSFNDHDDSWAWLKAKSRKFPDKPRTRLAHFRIDGGRLVAETNSRERAGRLRIKLKKHLGDLIAYEKTLYRDIDDIPELSPEESEAQRKRNEELNADPEIRNALKQHQDAPAFDMPKLDFDRLRHRLGLPPRAN